ncbi:MAG TPA: carboxypeptidase-like regulatory domain-containing protein, partial [Thermoanaerobaculia bacterium]|nr:carboxypeptidase-like regulatory domain-containing protein [Thermoanaerobaculia bacterium]
MRKLAVTLGSALVLLLVGSAGLAQTTGSIRGVVVAADNSPLPGVTLEAKSPNLQGSRTAVTDREGRFSLNLL